MFHVRSSTYAKPARHARLFELLRQQNLALAHEEALARQPVDMFKADHFEFRAERMVKHAAESLLRSA
ncbi:MULTISPECIES: hypothetical protein [unclassified Shimia]|uniref:hypothetical protein n=1 Tax=unclassified Shimia TaxID=2630038 RepID=UPI001ADAD373|nr:hypothetical protein [Shimia sp. R9_3]MBO9401470.1 hypothetical protein [Shimia sp. R9_3]